MINNIKIKNRLVFLIAIPIIAVLLLVYTSLSMTQNIVEGIQSLNDDRVKPLKQIKLVSDNYAVNIVDTFHKLRHGIIDESKAIAEIQSFQKMANQEWERYLQTTLTPREKELSDISSTLLRTAAGFTNTHLSMIKSEQFLSVAPSTFTRQMYDTFDPLSNSLKDLIDLQLAEASRFTEGSYQAYIEKRNTLSFISALLVIVLSILAIVIYKSIITPLDQMNNTANRIVSDHDFTIKIPEKGKDELSRVAHNINTLLSQFQTIITDINSASAIIDSESSALSSQSKSIADRTSHQEMQANMIATAVTEMSAAIAEVAQNAVDTSHQASHCDDIAKTGLDSVQEAIDAIMSLNQVISTTKDNIDELSLKSNEISDVVQIISSIAEQTNLLALNAAIEAARAGESGRGFAVVADEVRQLAHNTQSATEKINMMISSLQDASQASVTSMEKASIQAHASADVISRSAESINRIADSVSEIANMNMVVSTATEEQTSVANELSENINDVSANISQVADSALSNAKSCEALSALSTQLRQSVSQFKT